MKWEKKNNKHSLIINLREMNSFVAKHHFKTNTLRSAINMTSKASVVASVDLTNAYYSVSIENSPQTFFVFQFHRKCSKYASLVNDLTSASRIFTKIMKLVLFTLWKLGQKVLNCLDEIFICWDIFKESWDVVLAASNLLFKLDFFAHPENLKFTSMQETEYLGFVINSITMKNLW